ncbi:FERM ARHGEF and pleckstrin domain-containing protein 2 [Taenia solium]|eukprot:TsM_000348500 transcript=TsM_000348500 gene=TsM_000348500
MTTQAPRNGNLQDGGNVCSQTLGHLPTARVLSPNFLTTSQSGLSTACTVIPSAHRPASGRVVYVDSATGRLISDSQLVAVPRPLNMMGSGFSSAPASQAPTVATSPIGGPCGSSTAAATAVIGGPIGIVPQDIVNTAPIPGGSNTTSSLPQLLRSRPHGPPPPAPERRDSVQPRDRQLSSSTLDSGITSKSASLSRPSFDASAAGLEEDEELPPPPPPPPMEMEDPDPAHPFPFNVIPVEGDFATRRPMQASCLSLAARSVRSSCQSLLHTDEDLDEDGEELESRSLSHRQFASRSASLHRPLVKRDRCAEASTITQDDMATALAANRSSTNSSATGSVAAATSSASSRSLVSLSSKSRRDDRSLRSSRRGSMSGSSRNLPRAPASVAYHLLRELTMTERTYKKDLDVVCEGFREAFTEESKDCAAVESVFSKLFTLLDPLRAQAIDFLNELESRFAAWSTRLESTSRSSHRLSSAASAVTSASGSASSASASATSADVDADSPTTPVRIGDLFVTNLKMLQLYRSYLRETECLIIDLERLVRSRASFHSKMQAYEAQKSCYLPFYAFLLKPMHRLLQYRSVLERLMRHYNESNPDMQDCRVAHARLLDTIQSQWDSYKRCENLYKSLEVERDLVGVQTTSEATTVTSSGSGREKPTGWLASRSRQFIREGLLQKLSKKGYQQRMFFLFSDQLIYASRTNAPFLQFKDNFIFINLSITHGLAM